MIAYNAVYQYVADGRRIRVLDLDYDANFCVYIPIEGMRMPVHEILETLEALIESNELIEIVDPFYDVDIKEDYSDIDYQRCEERYEIIPVDYEDSILFQLTCSVSLEMSLICRFCSDFIFLFKNQ